MGKIENLRREIDETDTKIIRLLRQRFRIAVKIGKYKKIMGLKIRDFKRERQLLNRVAEKAKKQGIKDAKEIKKIFNGIMAYSRKVQGKI